MAYSQELLDSAAVVLGEVLRNGTPADAALSRHFREHRSLGQRERATLADTVYAALRRRRSLTHLIGRGSPHALVLSAWAVVLNAPRDELSGFVRRTELDRLARIAERAREPLPFELECDFPDWLIERLRRRFDDTELLRIAGGLNAAAPLDLRVNSLRATREEVLAQFAAERIAAAPTPHSPWGLRLAARSAVNRHPLFVAGRIEVQDEGSQLLCHLVAPRRGEMVVDFCAGAGGKTLALGAMMRSSGRLYAFDVSDRRLAKLKPRLARSGLSNVHPQRIANERDPRLGRLAGKVDRVLVDAPCTGLGTLRRNPDLKWRQTPRDVDELAARQAAILAAASRLVSPGGRVVYATCSLLDEENRLVVEGFLDAHPEFSLKPAGEVLAGEHIRVAADPYLELWPHVHGTDGFFAAVLERTGGAR